MIAADPDLPDVPVDLDNAFHQEMLNAVGYKLCFSACDAAWRAICRSGYTVTPIEESAGLSAPPPLEAADRDPGDGVAPCRAQHGANLMRNVLRRSLDAPDA